MNLNVHALLKRRFFQPTLQGNGMAENLMITTPEARSVGQPERAALGLLMGNLQPLTLPDTLDPLVVDYPARLAQVSPRSDSRQGDGSRRDLVGIVLVVTRHSPVRCGKPRPVEARPAGRGALRNSF
jgi:hypothetical protein